MGEYTYSGHGFIAWHGNVSCKGYWQQEVLGKEAIRVNILRLPVYYLYLYPISVQNCVHGALVLFTQSGREAEQASEKLHSLHFFLCTISSSILFQGSLSRSHVLVKTNRNKHRFILCEIIKFSVLFSVLFLIIPCFLSVTLMTAKHCINVFRELPTKPSMHSHS